MKTRMLKFLLLVSFVAIAGCGKDEPGVDGLQGDTIKFSATELIFDADGGYSTVVSEGNSWWINNQIYINGEDHPLYIQNADSSIFVERDTLNNNYSEITKIEGAWFTITRESTQKITFSVTENNTGKDRSLALPIQDRNYFTEIKVNQTAR